MTSRVNYDMKSEKDFPKITEKKIVSSHSKRRNSKTKSKKCKPKANQISSNKSQEDFKQLVNLNKKTLTRLNSFRDLSHKVCQAVSPILKKLESGDNIDPKIIEQAQNANQNLQKLLESFTKTNNAKSNLNMKKEIVGKNQRVQKHIMRESDSLVKHMRDFSNSITLYINKVFISGSKPNYDHLHENLVEFKTKFDSMNIKFMNLDKYVKLKLDKEESQLLTDSKKLLKSLNHLSETILICWKNTFTPGTVPDLNKLKDKLESFKSEFTPLKLKLSDLDTASQIKLDQKREIIIQEELKVKMIKPEYVAPTAVIFGLSTDEIQSRIENLKSLLTENKLTHDELETAVVKAKIKVDLIECHILRLDKQIFVISELNELNSKLAKLRKDIDTQKHRLRDNKEKSLEDYKVKYGPVLEGFQERYKTLSKKGFSLKDSTSELIYSLEKSILKKNPDTEIPKMEKSLYIYDETMKESVKAEIKTVLSQIYSDTEAMKQFISSEWNSIYRLIDQTLTFDLDRFMVSIDKGSVPYEKSFNTFYSPFIKKHAVESPFNAEEIIESNLD